MAINSPLNIAAQPGKTRLRKSLKLWQVVTGLSHADDCVRYFWHCVRH